MAIDPLALDAPGARGISIPEGASLSQLQAFLWVPRTAANGHRIVAEMARCPCARNGRGAEADALIVTDGAICLGCETGRCFLIAARQLVPRRIKPPASTKFCSGTGNSQWLRRGMQFLGGAGWRLWPKLGIACRADRNGVNALI